MTKMLSKTRESTSVSSENPACGKVECLGFYCFFSNNVPLLFWIYKYLFSLEMGEASQPRIGRCVFPRDASGIED